MQEIQGKQIKPNEGSNKWVPGKPMKTRSRSAKVQALQQLETEEQAKKKVVNFAEKPSGNNSDSKDASKLSVMIGTKSQPNSRARSQVAKVKQPQSVTSSQSLVLAANTSQSTAGTLPIEMKRD